MKKNIKNTNYYPTSNENFNKTLELLENDLAQEQIISMLQTGNIAEKQVAALKITHLENSEQANIMLDNLIKQDGKIREVISLKILEFSNEYSKYFANEYACNIFINAVIDVNPNICRNIITAISNLKSNEHFCKIFIPKLIQLIKDLITTVSKIDFKDGKYKINKEVFKLYWCLETLYELTEKVDLEVLKSIVSVTKNINEYTIREKTAKILSKNLNDVELQQIRKELQSDKNYYVRRF